MITVIKYEKSKSFKLIQQHDASVLDLVVLYFVALLTHLKPLFY